MAESSEQRLKRIFRSKAVDRVARRVTSAGIHYEPRINPKQFHSHAPGTICHPVAPHTPGLLLGKKFGSMTVISYAPKAEVVTKKRNGAMYLVRCQCGQYEHRKALKIRKMLASPDCENCCERCFDLRRLKKESMEINHGG